MKLVQNHNQSSEDQWISISDMMAGLMMIFLFIAIIYIQNLSRYFDEVNVVRDDICSDLAREFKKETKKWDMKVCENGLLITFENDSNFKLNSSVLSEKFKSILTDFFPRLMSVISKYKNSISELRIEGHTDSSVRPGDTELSGYLYNTKLSQDRSRNVMDFTLHLPKISKDQTHLAWAFSNITAHGMSSSDRIVFDGIENSPRSRRVEFRLRTRAEVQLLNLVSKITADGN